MKKLILIGLGVFCLTSCAHQQVKKTDDKAIANKAVFIVGKTFSGIIW